MKYKLFLSLIAISLLTFAACEDQTNTLDKDISTWDIIQSEILDKNCISCHTAGSSFARQSDLVLTKDVAYEQLVNVAPHNLAAKQDGLIRVGTKGLQSIYESFLWEKINFPDFEHYYADHPNYGELMPVGGPSLTNGQLRFISEWIMAGAPRETAVADPKLLDDEDRFEIPLTPFEPLAEPSSGLQLRLAPFPIAPQREREFFYYQELNNSEDLYVNRVEVTMREGSHHFILYDYPQGNKPNANEYRDFYNENGNFNFNTAASIFNQRFVFGTQWRKTDYHLPPGVALKLPANTGFDLNSHYVNRTDEPKTGEVSVNLHTIPKSQVNYIAENIFENYTDINIPAKQVKTLTRISKFDERMNIFQLTSHAHEHMTEFKIFIEGGPRDGELVFIAKDWEHPPIINYDPPIVLEAGQGLRAETTYDNDTDKALRFGLRSVDEMMIIFGAFYRD
jgi:hypothetical protein